MAITFDRIEHWVHSITPQLAEERPAAVFGILRGGAVPAVMVSHALGIPIGFIRFDRVNSAATLDSPASAPKSGSLVLLCDDLSGKGITLERSRKLLFDLGYHVKILTIAFDEYSRIRPDYAMDARGYRIVLPWERFVLSPCWQRDAARVGGGSLGPDHEYQVWCFVVEDVFPARDATFITSTPEGLTFLSRAIPRDRVIFLSRRPVADHRSVRRALNRMGFRGYALMMVKPNEFAGQEAVESILAAVERTGAMCLVVGNAHEAVTLALRAPHVHVMFADAVAKTGAWISATPQPSGTVTST